ncbi:MAG: DUF4352 domain-containing protein [Anaerolineae bacterium]|nr:DUF4352 domain-containing protein [Anaerolineae bacterium]
MSSGRAMGIFLITLGALIMVSLWVVFVIRDNPLLWGLLLGSALIAAGLVAVYISYQQNPSLADMPAPPLSSRIQSVPETIATVDHVREEVHNHRVAMQAMPETDTAARGDKDSLPLSRPLLIGGGIAFSSLVLLLLCILGLMLRPLFIVHETQVVDCEAMTTYTEAGWQVVAAYSYELGDAYSGYTVYNQCILEREHFVLVRDKQPTAEKAAFASTDTFNIFTEVARTPTPATALTTMTPALGLEPTQSIVAQATVIPLATPVPQATLTPFSTHTPWTTMTPLPSPTPRPTNTLLPTWTNTPIPTATPMPTPFPLPDAQTLGPILNSTYDETYSIQIAITEIREFMPESSFSAPKPGFTYIIAHLAIDNLGPDTIRSLSRSDFEVRDASGVLRGNEYLAEISDCALESVDLAADGKISGCVAFEVPDSGQIELIYAPYQYDSFGEGRHLSFVIRSGTTNLVPATSPTPLPLPNATLTEWTLPESQTIGPIRDSSRDEAFSVQITVQNVQWYAGGEFDKPKSGHIYSVVYLTIENLGPDPMRNLDRSDVQARDANGVIRDTEFALSAISDCALEYVDLLANGTIYGCIAFEVPDSGFLEMLYAPYQSDNLGEGRYLSFELRP